MFYTAAIQEDINSLDINLKVDIVYQPVLQSATC